MPVAHFSKIVIIQSLPQGDEFTGTKLHEDLETLNAYHDFGLEISLENVNTKSDLINALAKIESEHTGSFSRRC